MQREKATADWCVDSPVLDELPERGDEGLPPQAASSRASAAVAAMAGAVRAMGSDVRREGRKTQVLSFMLGPLMGLGRFRAIASSV